MGNDGQGRQQIVLWNLELLLSAKGVVDVDLPSSTPLVVAKQISDYSITEMVPSPWDQNTFISCGRENIRIWRVSKRHLPARPIILNGYCRGYNFTSIGVQNIASNDGKKFFYVASNKGTVLKVDYTKECVLCAFQLHSSPIASFKIYNSYAVSGSEDKRLRIWPLDFSDYLLEARHEGTVSAIEACFRGQLLAIGTTAGTLGILTVNQHRWGARHFLPVSVSDFAV